MNQEAIEILDTHLYGQYAPGTSAIKAYWESVFEQLDGVSSLSDVALTSYMSFFRLGLKNLVTLQDQVDPCRSADDSFRFCLSSKQNTVNKMPSFKKIPIEYLFSVSAGLNQ